VLESVLWDAEDQKLSGPALVGFVVSEVRARVPAYKLGEFVLINNSNLELNSYRC